MGAKCAPVQALNHYFKCFGQPMKMRKGAGKEKKPAPCVVEVLNQIVRRAVIDELLNYLFDKCSLGIHPTISIILRIDRDIG